MSSRRHPAPVDVAFLRRCLSTLQHNRNETAHDYGAAFAEATLTLLPDFISDASHLADVIEAVDRD